jgi:hypothetical protein
MRKQTALLVAAVLAMAASTASASLEVVGDPIGGDSWGQGFQWVDVAVPPLTATPFDGLEAWVAYSTPNNSVFLDNTPAISEPALGTFAVLGLSDARWGLLATTPTGILSTASNSNPVYAAGDSQVNLSFDVWFSGASTDKVDFVVETGNWDKYNPSVFDTVSAAGAYWNGSTWSITNYSTTDELATFESLYGGVAPIPEPAAVTVWSLLGVGVAGLALVRRRSRRGSP